MKKAILAASKNLLSKGVAPVPEAMLQADQAFSEANIWAQAGLPMMVLLLAEIVLRNSVAALQTLSLEFSLNAAHSKLFSLSWQIKW